MENIRWQAMSEKRWVQIASSVKGAIQRGELASGARIATDTEMAHHFNVSRVTVQRALGELQREGWVVRRRKAGTVVADRSSLPTTKIALVFTTLSDRPQCDYLSGIEESLAGKYQLVPMNTYRTIQGEVKCLEKAMEECSGIILYPSCEPVNTPLLKQIASKAPLVIVDRAPEGLETDTVMTDNFGSMLTGLNHLYSLGHRRIGYLMSNKIHISSVRERHDAYVQFMKHQFGDVDLARWERQFPAPMTRDQFVGSVEEALVEMLSEPDPITAVACQEDALRVVLLEACVHLDIRVPEDLAILSFYDNETSFATLGAAVHRLVQRSVEMGHMAARRIEQRLTTTPQSAPPQVMRLMTDLYPAEAHQLSPSAMAFAAKRRGGIAR